MAGKSFPSENISEITHCTITSDAHLLYAGKQFEDLDLSGKSEYLEIIFIDGRREYWKLP